MGVGYTKSALLGYGLFGQIAQNGQLELLVLADLDDHEDPGAENHGLEQCAKQVGTVHAGEIDHPIHDEPRDEEIETLESVEAHAPVGAEARGSQNHDGGQPAQNRDITKQRRSAWTDAVHVV